MQFISKHRISKEASSSPTTAAEQTAFKQKHLNKHSLEEEERLSLREDQGSQRLVGCWHQVQVAEAEKAE